MPDKRSANELMVDREKLIPLENKLAEIRKTLLGNPPLEELTRLQLHAQLLENALMNSDTNHDHDTNEHHDHNIVSVLPGLEPRAIQRRT